MVKAVETAPALREKVNSLQGPGFLSMILCFAVNDVLQVDGGGYLISPGKSDIPKPKPLPSAWIIDYYSLEGCTINTYFVAKRLPWLCFRSHSHVAAESDRNPLVLDKGALWRKPEACWVLKSFGIIAVLWWHKHEKCPDIFKASVNMFGA